MASELTVQTLKGPTSGANANKIIVPSGHTLAAAGHVVQVVSQEFTNQISTNIGSSTGQAGSYTGYLNYMARPVVDNSATTNFSFETLDSPSSTSTLTYTLQYCVNSGGTVAVGRRNSDTSVKSPTAITLMEIAQ